jgi:hypothetical protein
MNEKRDSIEPILDDLNRAIVRVHHKNRIETMWDPSIADLQIHLTEEELDEFLQTFSPDERGLQLDEWIRFGVPCERTQKNGEEIIHCKNMAVGSVDWSAVLFSDSTLVCREDLRPVYADIMQNGVILQGIFPSVTINGKELPKPKAA